MSQMSNSSIKFIEMLRFMYEHNCYAYYSEYHGCGYSKNDLLEDLGDIEDTDSNLLYGYCREYCDTVDKSSESVYFLTPKGTLFIQGFDWDISKVRNQSNSKYFDKDLAKSVLSNKMIAHPDSIGSTKIYMNVAEKYNKLNVGKYEKLDIVFVSVNGKRKGRAGIHTQELDLAVKAGASFICDSKDNLPEGNNPYNIGEQELAHYLESKNYSRVVEDDKYSIWSLT